VRPRSSESGSDSGKSSSTSSDSDTMMSPDRPMPGQKRTAAVLGEVTGVQSEFASKMMKKMGYQEGKGLGKYEQGRTEIVKESTHKGRRGLGVEPTGFETDFEKTWKEEDVILKEEVKWIPTTKKGVPSLDTMEEWIKTGPKKLSIDDETTFVDPQVLKNVLDCKSVFDNLEDKELRNARTKSNPFETIRGGIFQNRAAMKMANMDSVFDFMFSDPKDPEGVTMVKDGQLLYFADVAAGPGGFTEYVLWRRHHTHSGNVKGFGFTLRGDCDFKLDEFHSTAVEFFEPYYGLPLTRPGSSEEEEPNGDLTRPENLAALQKVIMRGTDGQGVHFMMADGGFSVEGQENIQEILSKQLYLCQFIAAMSMLRTHGSFVCKLFDLFTKFSVGLVYLMWRSFKQVTIHKPVTSRPANSERYIVCKHKLPDTEEVHEYLFEVNKRLAPLMTLTNTTEDIEEIVPVEVMQRDSEFWDFIRESNDELGKLQAVHLEKIRVFAQNPNLIDRRQTDIRKDCLAFWGVPNEMRKRPEFSKAHFLFPDLLSEDPNQGTVEELMRKPQPLTPFNLDTHIKSIEDFCFYVTGGDRSFFLGLGRENVWMWDGKTLMSARPKWIRPEFKMELPRRTLLIGEVVQERVGEGKGQRLTTAVHIIDSMFLGGVDVRTEGYRERMAKTELMTRALRKLTCPHLTPVRTKQVTELKKLEPFFQIQMKDKMIKGCGFPRRCYEFTVNDETRLLLPNGLVFMKSTKPPWITALSRSSGVRYWFHTISMKSIYERPPDSVSDLKFCLTEGSFVWPIVDGAFASILELESRGKRDILSLEKILQFIKK